MSTAEIALPYARRYIETREELKQNTEEALQALRTMSPLSEEFQAIWRRRDELHLRCRNEIAGLPFYPDADRQFIFNYIIQAPDE
ncbi:hypothetical protein SAMN04487895_104271 [Paenibacillus sophorae]|uniref:Uncharacterized protein n=1 Tax=Paenibacillus sophorae TaxID=1333845 RepID=A0A1H8LBQ0_9BACL|nr:hypothetical protein [Paenibacillus sophorae]QWU17345.1 hypothetical protein KP014_09435 [Paenibacillus sophorae]SEO02604.1 hypothetical protein SAMN04487895_104271 [Paenibacillus sophorae]